MKPVNNTSNIKIGQNLKRLRKQSKLTQSNIANVLGVSYQQIQKFEKGINRIFAHQILDICDEFDWDLNEFRASESSVSVSNS
jgi:transcriptional regulator with XRE-family HTH domain